ncbi:hypothetical protein BGS_1428 [Beggiatoa sp. SS]|nr:hypothetical protein BGS_1428 [Beggiatoa sp. SS]
MTHLKLSQKIVIEFLARFYGQVSLNISPKNKWVSLVNQV